MSYKEKFQEALEQWAAVHHPEWCERHLKIGRVYDDRAVFTVSSHRGYKVILKEEFVTYVDGDFDALLTEQNAAIKAARERLNKWLKEIGAKDRTAERLGKCTISF